MIENPTVSIVIPYFNMWTLTHARLMDLYKFAPEYCEIILIYDDFRTDIIELINEDNKMLVAGRVVDWEGGWNEFDIDGKHYVIPYAEGWLLGCTKLAWKGLGGFDPIYSPYDYEDLDLSMKAMSLEYNIVGLNSDKVKHLGGATVYHINPNRIEITQRNRELFISKWKDKIPTLILLMR